MRQYSNQPSAAEMLALLMQMGQNNNRRSDDATMMALISLLSNQQNLAARSHEFASSQAFAQQQAAESQRQFDLLRSDRTSLENRMAAIQEQQNQGNLSLQQLQRSMLERQDLSNRYGEANATASNIATRRAGQEAATVANQVQDAASARKLDAMQAQAKAESRTERPLLDINDLSGELTSGDYKRMVGAVEQIQARSIDAYNRAQTPEAKAAVAEAVKPTIDSALNIVRDAKLPGSEIQSIRRAVPFTKEFFESIGTLFGREPSWVGERKNFHNLLTDKLLSAREHVSQGDAVAAAKNDIIDARTIRAANARANAGLEAVTDFLTGARSSGFAPEAVPAAASLVQKMQSGATSQPYSNAELDAFWGLQATPVR